MNTKQLLENAEQLSSAELTQIIHKLSTIVTRRIIDQHEHLEVTPVLVERPKTETARGMVFMADDFDEPLEDFAAYM